MSKLPKGIIARGSRLSIRYKHPVTGEWRTDATGLALSEVAEAVRIRDALLGHVAANAPHGAMSVQAYDQRQAGAPDFSTSEIDIALGRIDGAAPLRNGGRRNPSVTSKTVTGTIVTAPKTVTTVTNRARMEMQKAIVCYIAGPFRAPTPWGVEQNVRRAEAVALDAWRAGLVALCPHLNSRPFEGACPDEVWLRGGIELLRRCDAVILVDGWERSSGTALEIKEAERLKIPVFSSVYAAIAWFGAKVGGQQR